jgi:HipA-like protein
MAASLWGKVYYNDLFAGELQQQPGGRCAFTYDAAYLEAGHPSIAFTLPLQAAPHVCEQGLHPFFDNLVAEGWLRNGCTQVDAWRLFRRVLVCFLTGNTDAHLKNFAMFHTRDGLRLTPAYDLVAAALYPEYRPIALAVGNASNLELGSLGPKHIVGLSASYGLSQPVLIEAIGILERRRKAAEKAVMDAARRIGEEQLGQSLLDFMERRWNGTFRSIGPYLSKKQSAAGTA